MHYHSQYLEGRYVPRAEAVRVLSISEAAENRWKSGLPNRLMPLGGGRVSSRRRAMSRLVSHRKKSADGCRFQPAPNVIMKRRLGVWPAAARTVRAASASVPNPDTAGRVPACRPRPAGDGRWCADQAPGSSRSPGRRHRAKAFRRPARPGWWATTACRDRWRGADSSGRRRARPRCAQPGPPEASPRRS
jgi:hypothetical protein